MKNSATSSTKLYTSTFAQSWSKASWSVKGTALLRILFGFVWAIDAWMKWQPGFINNFLKYLENAMDGQPAFVQAWIGLFLTIAKTYPHVFAYGVALAESALAISLLLGVFSNLAYIGGIILTLVIWSTAGGFGGPYGPGSTDIGASIIYGLVFAGLFLSSAGLCFGGDQLLSPRLGRWSFLASGQYSTTQKRNPLPSNPVASFPSIKSSQRSWLRGAILLAMVIGIVLVAFLYTSAHTPYDVARANNGSTGTMDVSATMNKGKYLYIWAGDVERKQPDRLVVLNYDEHSADYGKVVGFTEVPGSGGFNNEPHHCGLSLNLKVVACGGLLSVLKNQNGIFYFDISNPARPRYMFSARAVKSSITDAFVSLPNNGFLITQMGAANGGTPGRVAEVNGQDQIVHEWPDNPPADGFNPHGIDIRAKLNLMITSDFVDPASTLNVVPGAPIFRGSVRVWNLSKRTIVRTIHIPGAPGTMDCRLIPNDPQGRGFTAGINDGKLYLLDTQHGTAKVVFDFNQLAKRAAPQVMAASSDGKHLYVPLDYPTGGQVVDLNIADPRHPYVVNEVQLGVGSGPHMSMVMGMGTEQRLVVSDYFLNEDTFGKVHADGDHKLHVFDITAQGLKLDRRFEVNFDTAIPGVQLRPHGIVSNTDAMGSSD